MEFQIKFSITLLLLLFTMQLSFAHEGKSHEKKDQQRAAVDSLKTDSKETDIVHIESGHEHAHSEGSVSIVEAGWKDFPSLHPLIVHFPIVLLLLAFLTQLAALFTWKKELSLLTGILLLGGFIGAYLAGRFFHPHTGELTDAAQQVLDLHDRYADYTIWSAGIALLLKGISHFLLKQILWLEILMLILLGLVAGVVSKAGHYGATLVHIHEVGPQGNFLELGDHEH